MPSPPYVPLNRSDVEDDHSAVGNFLIEKVMTTLHWLADIAWGSDCIGGVVQLIRSSALGLTGGGLAFLTSDRLKLEMP